jgi:predicted negative regulator of RcsB-dependent stress response
MPAATGMIFDFILLAALGVVMYRAWQLSRQFTEMQANRAAFEQLIQALNIATQRAEGAIGRVGDHGAGRRQSGGAFAKSGR